MRRRLTTITIIVSILFATVAGTLLTTERAHAIAPWLWLLGAQVINDKRAEQPKEETPGINPMITVYDNTGTFSADGIYNRGHYEGDIQDPRTNVDRVARTAVIVIDPCYVGEGDLLGMDITSTSPFFPKKKGIYHKDFAKKFGKQVNYNPATDILIDGPPREGKYQIALSTVNLPFGAYSFNVWIWTTTSKKALLGLTTKDVSKRTTTVCRFRVADQAEMQEAANAIQVQRDLAVSEGLAGGPPQASVNQIVISPDTVQRMINEGLVQVPGQVARPAVPAYQPAPAQTSQPTASTTPTGLTAEQVMAMIDARAAKTPTPAYQLAQQPTYQAVQPMLTRVAVFIWLNNVRCPWGDGTFDLACLHAGRVVEFRRGLRVEDGRIVVPGLVISTAVVRNASPQCVEFDLVPGGSMPGRGDSVVVPQSAQGGNVR